MCEYTGLKGNRMVCSHSLGLLPRTGWELWKLQQVKINAGRQSNCKQKSKKLKDETKIGRGYLGIFYWAKDHHEISREWKSGATERNEHSLKMPQKPKLTFPKGICRWKTYKFKAEAGHMHDRLHGFLPMLTFTLLSTMTVFENRVFITGIFVLKGAGKSTLTRVLPFWLQIPYYLKGEIKFNFPSLRWAENFAMADQPPL